MRVGARPGQKRRINSGTETTFITLDRDSLDLTEHRRGASNYAAKSETRKTVPMQFVDFNRKSENFLALSLTN